MLFKSVLVFLYLAASMNALVIPSNPTQDTSAKENLLLKRTFGMELVDAKQAMEVTKVAIAGPQVTKGISSFSKVSDVSLAEAKSLELKSLISNRDYYENFLKEMKGRMAPQLEIRYKAELRETNLKIASIDAPVTQESHWIQKNADLLSKASKDAKVIEGKMEKIQASIKSMTDKREEVVVMLTNIKKQLSNPNEHQDFIGQIEADLRVSGLAIAAKTKEAAELQNTLEETKSIIKQKQNLASNSF